MQEQLNKREVVMASEIMDMIPTNPANGLSGYYLTPAIGAYCARISGDSISRALKPANEAVSNIEPRPECDQYLSNWKEEDFQRLGLASKHQLCQDIEKEEGGERALQLSLEEIDLGILNQIKR
jgi:hypothetical protein